MSPALALTTTFIPSPSCLTDIYMYTLGGIHYFSLGPPNTNCFPSGWQPATAAYFSPGICPQDYGIACSSYNSIDSLTETVATCCPKLDSSLMRSERDNELIWFGIVAMLASPPPRFLGIRVRRAPLGSLQMDTWL
jgi:hypothetical protein